MSRLPNSLVIMVLTRDEIDRVLAQHYGVIDEELDFIPSAGLRAAINYDIKYRKGRPTTGNKSDLTYG